MPGHANTLSVTTANATTEPNSSPITVTIGIMMFLSTCTPTIRALESPLARANFTYSIAMASRTPARVSRINSDSLNRARFTAGKIKCSKPSSVKKLTGTPNKSTVSPRPFEGNQPKNTANSMMSISPTQKVGKLKPRMDAAMIVLPINPSGLSPAISPSGMPKPTAINIAVKASSSVAGIRVMMSSSAGTPCAKLLPRSPVRAPTAKLPYCDQMDLSSPSATIARSRSA